MDVLGVSEVLTIFLDGVTAVSDWLVSDQTVVTDGEVMFVVLLSFVLGDKC